MRFTNLDDAARLRLVASIDKYLLEVGINMDIKRKHGDVIDVPNLGKRKVRMARIPGPCTGWSKTRPHDIAQGDLYVETELSGPGNPWAMDRCCLDCLE